MDDLAIDITRLLGRRLKGRRPTGVDRVGLAYVSHFGGAAVGARAVPRRRPLALVRLAGRWLFFTPQESQRLFAALLSEREPSRAALVWTVLQRLLRPAPRPSRGAWLLNVVHSGLDRGDYARQLGALGLRAACFLHDLIPLTHPQYSRAGEAERHRRRVDTALRLGRALIVNSGDTLQALQRHAHAAGLALPPVAVAPLAPAALANAPAASPALPYFLVLGTVEPRKNHAGLLRVWRERIAPLGAAAPELVVIGQPGWLSAAVIAQLQRADPARERVRWLPRCDDAELAAWLSGARALLFPSFVEGYGLPLVEALSLGVPVIASDLAVFREVAGDIPCYLPPGDDAAWAAAVLAHREADSPARLAQLQRLRGYVAPDWAAHFGRVEALLEQVDAAR